MGLPLYENREVPSISPRAGKLVCVTNAGCLDLYQYLAGLGTLKINLDDLPVCMLTMHG